MAAQGRDIKLSAQRVEGYRNFATKLWNACRFAEMNACVTVPGFDPRSAKETLNRWIAHETAQAARAVTQAIEAYKFNEAAAAVYRFVWHVYCDWFVELAKPVLQGPDGPAKIETSAMAAWARDEILKLLHPFMPFVTEELWSVTASAVIPDAAQRQSGIHIPGSSDKTGTGVMDSGLAAAQRPGMTPRESLLVLAPWPAHEGLDNPDAEAEIGWVIDLVTAIRSVRVEMGIAQGIEFPLLLIGATAATQKRAGRWEDVIRRLARLSGISTAVSVPPGAVQLIVRGEVAALPLKGVIDFAAEKARLEKELARVDADMARIDAKLGNADFVARAPEEVVEGEREKREEAAQRRAKFLEALERLKGAA
jgi:valyl-tRNA synthetase